MRTHRHQLASHTGRYPSVEDGGGRSPSQGLREQIGDEEGGEEEAKAVSWAGRQGRFLASCARSVGWGDGLTNVRRNHRSTTSGSAKRGKSGKRGRDDSSDEGESDTEDEEESVGSSSFFYIFFVLLINGVHERRTMMTATRMMTQSAAATREEEQRPTSRRRRGSTPSRGVGS